jgi:hypothetical protein
MVRLKTGPISRGRRNFLNFECPAAEPKCQRFNRVQDLIHHAILADGRLGT